MDATKLKIVFLTAYFAENGTYFRWHNFAIGLVNLGHQVEVFAVDNDTNPVSRVEVRDNIKYTITTSAKGKSLFGAINHPITSFKRIFDRFPECDILHVFQPFLSVYLPWRFNLKYKAKVTFFDWDDLWADTERDKEKRNFRAAWDYKLKRYFEKKIPLENTNMTTCSEFLKKLAIERGTNNVDVIPNGFWEYDIPAKPIAREKLGLKQDILYVGFMGRTIDELHWIFAAFKTCLEYGFNIRFALCGPTEEILQDVPGDIKDRLDYLGSISPADTRYFAAAIDIGLIPLMGNDFNESRFPIKFAEYLAANLPVLCSEVGEVSKYAKKYPWVIKAGTTKDDWIKYFINTIKLFKENKIEPVNRGIVLNDLSWNGISKQLEQVYLKKFKSENISI